MNLHRISLALAASLLVPSALKAQDKEFAPAALGSSTSEGVSGTSGTIFKPSLPKKPIEFKDSSGTLDVWVAPFFVLLLLIAVLWFLNRKGFFGKFKTATSGKLKIKDQVMLGNRQFLVVAEYGSREVMLGIGPGFVSHVCDLGQRESEFETALTQKIETTEEESKE